MVPLDDKIERISAVLIDAKRPLKERFRALFTLRNLGGEQSINAIEKCFSDSSSLLKHELAYCLGQMMDKRAVPCLVNVLMDTKQAPMVRHEAGEALGAIGCESAVGILKKYLNDPQKEVAETCHLAIKRINWLNSNPSKDPQKHSNYLSIDPAPPENSKDVPKLRDTLLNENEDLFKRYQAMFALRNINSDESVLALCYGLKSGSDLFKHEVAFVLGQIQSNLSVPYLIDSLENDSLNEMVRHECAEALGSIATDVCINTLRKYLNDSNKVVRESCEVALDMADYELSNDFQYANTVLNN